MAPFRARPLILSGTAAVKAELGSASTPGTMLARQAHHPRTRRLQGGTWGKVAGVTGLEPATSGVTGQRSNQLSYTT